MARRFDIVIVTDTRLPGGTSASVAEEIRAQADAGYRTAVLQVDSSLVNRPRPMSPRLRASLERGEFTLVLGDEPVEADLVVLRHPTVAREVDPATAPSIRAPHRLVVANQAPGTPEGPDPTDDQGLRYEPREVGAHLEDWLGGPVGWAPIGPLVRADLTAVAPDLVQRDEDWVNVIDVAAWGRPRERARGGIPVIGRHSRDHAMKWPATRAEVLRVYPARDDLEVQVLGGESRIEALFTGRPPANWVVHPFGSVPPQRFLAGIDVYVYYHHPAWVEAFGRSIMEALASGAPTVLPPHFAPLFEDAALYAEPDEVLERVRSLHADAASYRDASERAWTFVSERFGHDVHRRRLADLAEPTGTPRPRVPAASEPSEPPSATASSSTAASSGHRRTDRRRVLFVSSNGAGVGHLMRLMALARHAPADVAPLFLTFSQGAKVVDDAGYLVEYLASRSISGAVSTRWHPMLRERVNELIERYDVRAVVFDGTWPYKGLMDAVADHPDVRLVWSRRAMWKPGVSNPVLDLETGRFDLVLEPGEFAADEDRGATRDHRARAVRLGPVTYLGAEELLDRDDARRELGLDPDRPAALVNLGAGNINDVSSLLGMVVERLAEEPDLQVCVIRSIIADRAATLPHNVRPISVYPLARYLGAFDLAFAASGYNSYHELLLAGVPTAFVPNVDTATDDQAARARFAHRVGVGIDLGPEPSRDGVHAAVGRLMDPDLRRRMRERTQARRLDNGAPAGMTAIVDLLGAEPSDTRVSRPASGPDGRESLRDGAKPSDTRVSRPAGGGTGARSGGGGARDRSGGACDRSGGAGGAGGVSVRRIRRGVVGRLRPLLAKVEAEGPLRDAVARPFHALPAPVRRVVRRGARRLQPPRPKAPKLGPSTLPIPLGSVLDEQQALRPARIAIVLPVSADAEVVSGLVDHVAQLQAASRGFAALFLTSNVDFRPFRRYSYLFEYLPDPQRWERVEATDTWSEARQRRVSSILRRFAVTSVVTLPEPVDGDLGPLRSVLSAVIGGVAHR